jgi:hypothetical protein
VEDEDGCQLAGLVMFLREDRNIVILHLAVAPAFATLGRKRDLCVALSLVQAVRTLARQVRGITSILFFYPTGVPRCLDILPGTPRESRRNDDRRVLYPDRNDDRIGPMTVASLVPAAVDL